MKDILSSMHKITIVLILICNLLQGCTRQSPFESLIGLPVIKSHVESGLRFRREYYVYSKNNNGEGNVFDSICSKVSSKFSDQSIFDAGGLKFEINKSGYPPDLPKWFLRNYTAQITRHYALSSKDMMSSVDVYESEEYVFVILAEGS